tara:strand:+ start:990 stop:1820 length:831 start_codon:yes stop_codon:yes gene_type:complete
MIKIAYRLLSAKKKYVWPKVDTNAEIFNASSKDLPAESRLVILFTPRSGSSRFCEILTNTEKVGLPGEVFNPELIPKVSKRYAATSLDNYINSLLRCRVSGGVFSCKLTFWHLYQVFGTTKNFISLVQPTQWVWLQREDIVSQALSMVRMHQTGFAHSKTSEVPKDNTDAGFHYDAIAIARAIMSILFMERCTEALINRHSLAPLRLKYEELSTSAPREIVQKTLRYLDIPFKDMPFINASHRKISSTNTAVFKQRFTDNHPIFMRIIDALRRRCL